MTPRQEQAIRDAAQAAAATAPEISEDTEQRVRALLYGPEQHNRTA